MSFDSEGPAMARARAIHPATIAVTPIETITAATPCPVCGVELDARECRFCRGKGAVNSVGDDGRFESESCDRCAGTGSEFWCENCGTNR